MLCEVKLKVNVYLTSLSVFKKNFLVLSACLIIDATLYLFACSRQAPLYQQRYQII